MGTKYWSPCFSCSLWILIEYCQTKVNSTDLTDWQGNKHSCRLSELDENEIDELVAYRRKEEKESMMIRESTWKERA